MTAGRGVAWLYDHITRGQDEEAVDRIDALVLGDPEAMARVEARDRQERLLSVAAAGAEIG